MACHVSTCMAICHAYIRGSHGLLVEARESSRSVHGSSKEKRKGGKEKEEERKRERRKGNEEGRKGKEKGKKKREEERGGREEKERGRGRSVAQRAAPDCKEPGTALQEVGFLLHWLFYA